MNPLSAKLMLDRVRHWLSATSIQQRLRYLTLLNVAGLVLLLGLSLVSSALKDGYFDALQNLNTQQRQLQHFNTETARLQVAIQNYLNSSDEGLQQEIDKSTERLFEEFSQLEKNKSDYTENLLLLRESLKSFITGYRELKQLNHEIDKTYQNELIDPSRHAAELLAMVIGSSSQKKGQTLLGPASVVAVNAFIDALLKMNVYYAKRETVISLSTRSSLERVAQLAPLLESLAPGEFERKALNKLQKQVHTMISGLGSLQRSYAIRTQIMETRIEANQRAIAHTAESLDKRYAEIESTLRNRYSQRLSFINAFAIVLSLLIIAFTFGFGALVFNSIRTPLAALLRTVEAFSSGNFQHPVPEVGHNELGMLAGGLREFRNSAMQRTLAEHALRDSEGRFRALSDMSSDFFWEQNEMLQYTAFSGQRAGELLARNVLMLGLRAWDNPRNLGYEDSWAQHRLIVETHQAFRDFEFSLQMPDGKLLHLLASGDPVFGINNEFTGYRGTAKDISAQKSIEAEIRQLNQTLEQRVIERTTALRQSNDQLSQAMEQLVQSEKLASLGNLVAGVAHELNTPLGNALVASTSLRDQVRDMNRAVDAGTLRKSDLTEFMATCEEGCLLIERNAYRAVTLVSNFKQVAVDQTSAQRREFNLQQTIQEVVATLSPTLRKQQHTLTVDIPANIVLDSYPGPLDQVITNIITNATVHAFQPGQPGALLISATAVGYKEVVIMLSDNGGGIPLDKQGRVFDPFFTTRLGQGGSGLGLYIVYNIVTSLLGGHIQLVSTPGTGTCFLIHIPLDAPHADENAANVHGSPQLLTQTTLDLIADQDET
ncbi:hypothetical protein GCM10027046_19640 [Uliginosibacterium flavum]|uniref:histidine kinase n=1 Tax=Uliginosibacterium flavum TaxID=1396831 RepID=A0ABV2TFT9_9RHOO